MLNSPLRQTAEPVCMCVSWALTLFFSLSWRQLPWGLLSAWEHKGSPGARPYTLHILYMFEPVTAWSFCYQESWLHKVGMLLTVSLGLIFIPILWWNPNSQPLPPDRGSWGKKKKTRSTPKNSCNMCMLRIQQHTLKTNNFLPHHTYPQLDTLACLAIVIQVASVWQKEQYC